MVLKSYFYKQANIQYFKKIKKKKAGFLTGLSGNIINNES